MFGCVLMENMAGERVYRGLLAWKFFATCDIIVNRSKL